MFHFGLILEFIAITFQLIHFIVDFKTVFISLLH